MVLLYHTLTSHLDIVLVVSAEYNITTKTSRFKPFSYNCARNWVRIQQGWFVSLSLRGSSARTSEEGEGGADGVSYPSEIYVSFVLIDMSTFSLCIIITTDMYILIIFLLSN
jgi:hypothetical protein